MLVLRLPQFGRVVLLDERPDLVAERVFFRREVEVHGSSPVGAPLIGDQSADPIRAAMTGGKMTLTSTQQGSLPRVRRRS